MRHFICDNPLRDHRMAARYAVISMLVSLHVSVLSCGCSHFGRWSPVNKIPPESATISNMYETAVRIHLYMVTNRVPPPDLSVLPVRKGHVNDTKDGWGRDLQYSVNAAGVITLMSYGQEGPRGAGHANHGAWFRTRNADGSLNVDGDDWILTAEVHQEQGRSPQAEQASQRRDEP